MSRLPQGSVRDGRVRWIEQHVSAANVLVLVQHHGERLTSIGRAKDAALFVWSIRMAGDGDQNRVGVTRINGDLRNLLPIAQTQVHPGVARICRSVNPVSDRQVGSLQAFATAGINNAGIGWCYGDTADRPSRLIIEDWSPGAAVIVGLPNTAVHLRDVKNAGL